MNKKLQLTCWGGVGSVTGANFILEDEHTRIAVDCGLLQGVPESREENSKKFPYDPQTVDFLFITHAHMDHIGKVPKLVKDGFHGVIYSTPETKELARLMLTDALKVMRNNANVGNILLRQGYEGQVGSSQSEAVVPELYGPTDLDKTLSLWQTLEYHTETKISDEFSVYILDAGHILGSAMYQFTHGNRKIFFTGDSGNSPAPLLKDTEKIVNANYLIMDSVYGDRNHEPKEERDIKFRQIVIEAIHRGGALVIPAFSLERTQVMLYELNNLVEEKKIPSVPVFLDSPLGLKVTDVYRRMAKDFNVGVQNEIRTGDDIFNFPKLHITHSGMESRQISETPNPKIIIAGSGMSSGGRVLHHEISFLPDPKSTLLLVGYQAIGTLGREIQEFTPASLKLRRTSNSVEIDGQTVPVRARIEMISGYSSHRDSNGLVELVSNSSKTLRKVFVVMGEPKASTYLVQRLHDELGVDAVYPERGKVYDLE